MFQRLISQIPVSAPKRDLAPWQKERAQALLLKHLDVGITVSDLAAACALSRSDFTRKFKVTTGHSPQAWMRILRVEKAKQLMRESAFALAEIGLQCGFCDQAHFCRIFCRIEGVTPLSWQRRFLDERRQSTWRHAG
ncbi:AraC family transcriptional regulator [Pseudomonas nicosulfuronedens]|uniref:Helix-turn-helix transcriptional regulator n=1 Tax=Pseudomonas nicosulfuronedens TaxID=2571105 RepID=A0A5R9QU01_9PSED|nr:AraC family transcriptional regulator [Pseudomonas nicosulfuronedens]MDH1010006.1 AraC family transcriptional regulator [Pseudomonas nicosulfuronedens]MDH1983184.1 AraC family transcriptional regulator [Pseudomonas nicosulfuronedens]MDH2030807.1 AraC family transcriptional regulator [Pseudomonas nicosulfuronedens]TLX73528.1 helix-turn-helix transcriptional regulator [Pseudomonas nicosulfuronedens]